MIDRIRKIGYLLAYAVATIPLWHYTLIGHMWIMATVVLFAYFMVVLSSVQASQTILSSEKSKITFPRWLPNKPKYQKWWSLFRYTLKWHLLLVIPKMGLTLGLVHVFGSYGEGYTNITTELLNSPSTLLGFFFSPYIFYNFGSYSSTIVPEWQTALLAITSVIVFAIAKCGILSSLIILFNETQYSSFFKKTLFFAFRYFIMMFAIIGFLIVLVLIYRSPIHHSCSSGESCTIEEVRRLREIAQSQYRLKVRVGETINTGIFTLVGDGVFLSSNIMSPVGDKLEYDNRPFVARQVVAGLLGLILYAGTTCVILWFVEDEHEHVVT